jgi:hypothetical protein
LAEAGNRLTDTGEVLIRFEELSATLQTQLKRALPASAIDRQRLLSELKRHRLIRVAPDFSMDDEDALLAIRPTILGIISDDMLEAALDAEQPLTAQTEPEEADTTASMIEEEQGFTE